ncbi:MAG: MYXO-CTERM sorting domain-containing protein, partial [Myxococcaceae bacterium]
AGGSVAGGSVAGGSVAGGGNTEAPQGCGCSSADSLVLLALGLVASLQRTRRGSHIADG